jgi:L-malate glycosyltransferase
VHHLCHVLPSFGVGGVELRLTQFINRYPDRYRHTIVALDGNTSCGVRISPTANAALMSGVAGKGSLHYPLGLARQLHLIGPDMVHTYGWGGSDGVLAARLARIPVLHHETGLLAEETNGQFPRRLWVRRAAFRLARGIVVPSFQLERIAREQWWIPRQRIERVAEGVDAAIFHPATAETRAARRAEFRIEAHVVTIGTVGTLRTVKNHLRLLEAFRLAAIPDSLLLMIGDGPWRDRLAARAAELGVAQRVTFAGELSTPVDALHAMDIYAISSDSEQMPTSALQAMACGLPIASTDVGDMASMVALPNRPYVNGTGAEELARSLRALGNDRALRARLGVANRERAGDVYPLERTLADHARITDAVLSRR